MSDLACRSCRTKLTADVKGCAICKSIRNHLILLDAVDDTERPALTTVSQEMVKFLRERHRYYETELRTRPGNEALAKGAIANANAMTKLLEAARRLQGDGLAAVEAMSFVERARLFVQWYASLVPAYRGRLREQMAKFEESQMIPVGPTHMMLPAAED